MEPLTKEEIYKNLIAVTGTKFTGISGGYDSAESSLKLVNLQIQALIKEGKIESEEEVFDTIIDLGSGKKPRLPNFEKIKNYIGVDITFENKKLNIVNDDMLLFLRKQKDKSANIYLGAITDDMFFRHTKDKNFRNRYITELTYQIERVTKRYIIITGLRDFLLEFKNFENIGTYSEIWRRK